jgi:hypothetical protein
MLFEGRNSFFESFDSGKKGSKSVAKLVLVSAVPPLMVKMCGWNEPERVNVQSAEVKVDAALIEQLRAGYAELGIRQQQKLAASVAASGDALGDLKA